MLTNEDLLAISNLMDVKLKPIKEDIAELKQDVAVLKKSVSGLEQAVSGLKKSVSGLEHRVYNVELILESDMQPRLQNIENCYVTTYHRYHEKTEQLDAVQADVDILKGVAQEHSIKIKALSQSAI